jgi:hypothetical protein
MDEDLKRVSKTYAARYSLTLAKQLGSGIHGIVLVAQSKLQPGRTALKLHRDFMAYDQESAFTNACASDRFTRFWASISPLSFALTTSFWPSK